MSPRPPHESARSALSGRAPNFFFHGCRIEGNSGGQWTSLKSVMAKIVSRPRPAPVVVRRAPAIVRTYEALERIAPLAAPLLLLGETGSGKELAAAHAHACSPRARAPFVAINCAAIPGQLAESELFGHVRGAFTGATRTRAGAFSRADGGTLFLDEIGELPLAVQAKLLRVLDSQRFSSVGSEVEVETDVRVIAATCRDLARMVAEGRFREDLYHRLGVFPLRVPPLRERVEDIGPLMEVFAQQAARDLGHPVHVSACARAAARRYPWPGNVRELRNAVLRAATLGGGRVDARALFPPANDPTTPPSRAQERVSVRIGDYTSMRHALLRAVVEREGSIRRAARVLAVPRSTLSTWLRAGADAAATTGLQASPAGGRGIDPLDLAATAPSPATPPPLHPTAQALRSAAADRAAPGEPLEL